ncbi:MAG: class I SAM-dependent methyltransferase [Candidatus Shapirobacteria bacterium]|jgi:ubiquinone/menaquinone biosynthesis C-methylase UbiE
MKVVDSKSTIKWYDANAKDYALNSQPYLSKDLADRFIDLVGIDKTILDAGSAAGRDSGYFFSKGLNVVGVDLSDGLVKIAKEKYPKISFIKADFKKLPFNDNYFDGIWAHASLVHMDKVEDTQFAIEEFKRVLKKDGILYIYVKTSKKETDIVSDKLSNHSRFFRYYSKKQIEGLITGLDFRILSSEFDEDLAGRKEVRWVAIFAKKSIK